jgi:orotidine-5'-phosphate decarboxylase
MNIFVNRPMFWRTFEALAIAMVFCAIAGVSIHRVSPLPGRTTYRAKMSEQRNASQRVTPAAKVLALAEQPAVTLESRRSTEADVVAEDIVIRYHEGAMNLHGPAIKPTGGTVQAQLLSPENTTLKPGVRFTFGTDVDMLAADTVVSYGADSSASRVQDQKKAALNPRAYK